MPHPQTTLPDFEASTLCAAPPPFACSWSDEGVGAALVQVSGELDIATSPQLEQALGEVRGARLVVLDLRELVFIDACGVHVIVDASNAARRGGRRLISLRARAGVDAVFTLTGAAEDVEVVDLDADQPALQALPQSRQRTTRVP